MKKAMVNVPFDEEKLAAARLYMEQKDLSFEEEMIRAAEALYGKYVPANVREKEAAPSFFCCGRRFSFGR